jgi:predicted peroxiredoxin
MLRFTVSTFRPSGRSDHKESAMRTWNRPLAFVVIVLALVGVIGPTTLAEGPVRDGVFVHISHGSDDPHRLLMGLSMAGIMAESRDVLVYFDITAVEVTLKDAKDVTYSHFPSSNTQIEKLLAAGVDIRVCPGCLKAAGKAAEDVRDGIRIADKDAFFSFTKGRILSVDY